MGSRLGSLQLHLLKMGGLATLAASPPKEKGVGGALQAGSTCSCCPSTSPCGSFPGVSGLQAKGVGRSPTVGR